MEMSSGEWLNLKIVHRNGKRKNSKAIETEDRNRKLYDSNATETPKVERIGQEAKPE